MDSSSRPGRQRRPWTRPCRPLPHPPAHRPPTRVPQGPGPTTVGPTTVGPTTVGLPTVGPLLLNSLLAQDMYLAGSILLILSALTVIGTLISDLLLAWVDPRIRFEGGGGR